MSIPMDDLQGDEVERRIIGNFDVVSRTLNNAIEHRTPVKGLSNPSLSNANANNRSQRRMLRHEQYYGGRESSPFPGIIPPDKRRQGQVSRINQDPNVFEED